MTRAVAPVDEPRTRPSRTRRCSGNRSAWQSIWSPTETHGSEQSLGGPVSRRGQQGQHHRAEVAQLLDALRDDRPQPIERRRRLRRSPGRSCSTRQEAADGSHRRRPRGTAGSHGSPTTTAMAHHERLPLDHDRHGHLDAGRAAGRHEREQAGLAEQLRARPRRAAGVRSTHRPSTSVASARPTPARARTRSARQPRSAPPTAARCRARTSLGRLPRRGDAGRRRGPSRPRHLLGLPPDRAVPPAGEAVGVVARVLVGVGDDAERLEGHAVHAQLLLGLAHRPQAGSSPASTTPPAAKSSRPG